MHPSYSIWEFGEYIMKDMYRCQYFGCKDQRTLPFYGCCKEHSFALMQIKAEIKKRQSQPFTRYSDIIKDDGILYTTELSWTTRPFTDFDLSLEEINYYAKLV